VRLFALSAAHPSVEVRVLAQALIALVLTCLACVEGKVEAAKKWYGEAKDMLRQVVEAIQRS
jgi:hypothetical protein